MKYLKEALIGQKNASRFETSDGIYIVYCNSLATVDELKKELKDYELERTKDTAIYVLIHTGFDIERTKRILKRYPKREYQVYKVDSTFDMRLTKDEIRNCYNREAFTVKRNTSTRYSFSLAEEIELEDL